ncbi:MAG: hypothetical protein QOH35_411 [Acidobacteriaceae bacterium]|jgi:hypothetical protein|nr:hypothetical protein [Acidobacteriaceae bacterium]
MTLLGGTTWRLAARMQEVRLIRNMAVQVIASVIFLESWTIVAAEEAAIPSDHKFVDEIVSELGFQPTDLIQRVRQLSNIPSEAAMQHRLSYCVQGYADRIATDAKLREKVASEVEERTCAQLGLCQERGQQRIDQSSLYAELLRVVAGEMRGEKRADSSNVFQEHEQFVEFGRHLARQSGIEETFRQASYVSAQISARHIRESCPPLWNSWLIQVSALIGIGVLGVVLALVYKRTTIKPAPT